MAVMVAVSTVGCGPASRFNSGTTDSIISAYQITIFVYISRKFLLRQSLLAGWDAYVTARK